MRKTSRNLLRKDSVPTFILRNRIIGCSIFQGIRNNTLKYLLLSIFTIILLGSAEAQTKAKPRQKLTVTEWIHAMRDCKDSTYVLREADIIPDPETDSLYLKDIRNRTLWWTNHQIEIPFTEINKEVYLIDIRFGERVAIPRLNFKKHIHLEKIDAHNDIFFRDCIFEGEFTGFDGNSYFWGFEDCTFKKGFYWEKFDVNALRFFRNIVFDRFQVFNTREPLSIYVDRCQFEVNYATIYSDQGGDVSISHSSFKGQGDKPFIEFGGTGFIDFFTLLKDTFHCNVSLANVSVKERVNIEQCQFDSLVAMQGFKIPQSNTNARWSQFSGNKLAIIHEGNIQYETNMPLNKEREDYFFNIIKSYSQLLRAYKNNGDGESADKCFIEMKDLTTAKSYWNWKQKPTVNHFMDWQLKRFLRTFCDYGVNPGKALYYSVFFIAFFALFYMAMPPEPMHFTWKEVVAVFFKRKGSFWSWTKEKAAYAGYIIKLYFKSLGYSMNAFVTLGFGKLPGTGAARYVAVVEGIIGWFLFSVFGASLIGQILQ